MKFENGIPNKQIDEEHFSVFAAINHLAKYFHIEAKEILRKAEVVNRFIVSTITSILLSGFFLSIDITDNKFLTFIISYVLSYLFIYSIELITKKVYKPRFYDQNIMKLADVINKLSGPNKNWDIVATDEFELRKVVEYRFAYLSIATFSMFGLMIIYAVISKGYSNPITLVDSEILRNAFSSGFFYFLFVLAFVHISFSLSKKKTDLFIYGPLLIISVIALFYFVVSAYFLIYFGG